MSDKFVVSTNEIGAIIVTDVETDRVYFYDSISDFFGLIRLLNEQQATISQLKQEIGEWKKENRELLDQIQEFERIPKSIREQWVE